MTYSACFIEFYTKRNQRDGDDTAGIDIVLIAEPQNDAEYLKHVKWIYNLQQKHPLQIQQYLHRPIQLEQMDNAHCIIPVKH